MKICGRQRTGKMKLTPTDLKPQAKWSETGGAEQTTQGNGMGYKKRMEALPSWKIKDRKWVSV